MILLKGVITMLTQTTSLYEAFVSKDARFDGEFFVGIRTTGIYCRPICKARKPRFEHCSFYATCAEAELNGFRPCLLCRPELAPGHLVMDASHSIATAAAVLLEMNCSHDLSMEDIADKLECSSRHLRRVFFDQYHVTLTQYLQTCRLLLAKQLLTETHLSIIDVSLACGFGSLRRFNALFKERYNLTPSQIRKKIHPNPTRELTLLLSYRDPYPWDQQFQFLRDHLIPGVEYCDDHMYLRSLRILKKDHTEISGTICVRHQEDHHALSLTLSESLIVMLPYIISRVQNLFDLSCQPHTIYESLMSSHDDLKDCCCLGTRIPGCIDPFETAVQTLLYQNYPACIASVLMHEFVKAFGSLIPTKNPTITHTFCTPHHIVSLGASFFDCMNRIGFSNKDASNIYVLAKGIVDHVVCFEPYRQKDSLIQTLQSDCGMSRWTADYLAIRTTGALDLYIDPTRVFHDLPEITKHKTQDQLKDMSPWRSYAFFNHYFALKQGGLQ